MTDLELRNAIGRITIHLVATNATGELRRILESELHELQSEFDSRYT